MHNCNTTNYNYYYGGIKKVDGVWYMIINQECDGDIYIPIAHCPFCGEKLE